MNEVVKQLGKVIICVLVFGLLLAIVWNITDEDGNTGIFGILAAQVSEESLLVRSDMEAVESVLSMERPKISVKQEAVSGTGITARSTIYFNDFITAVHTNGEVTQALSFPDQICVDSITDREGNVLVGFTKGDLSVVFPEKNMYVLTVTATYEAGCSTTKDVAIMVKK